MPGYETLSYDAISKALSSPSLGFGVIHPVESLSFPFVWWPPSLIRVKAAQTLVIDSLSIVIVIRELFTF